MFGKEEERVTATGLKSRDEASPKKNQKNTNDSLKPNSQLKS